AAARWKVNPSECHAERSVVIHRPSGRRATFGTLAAAAAKLPRPTKPRLKRSAKWTLIGKSLPRVENAAKVSGRAIFGIDVTVPGMLYGAVKTSPVFGGKVAAYDKASIRAFPGFVDVVDVPNGVVVVAKSYWQARNALTALPLEFANESDTSLSSET